MPLGTQRAVPGGADADRQPAGGGGDVVDHAVAVVVQAVADLGRHRQDSPSSIWPSQSSSAQSSAVGAPQAPGATPHCSITGVPRHQRGGRADRGRGGGTDGAVAGGVAGEHARALAAADAHRAGQALVGEGGGLVVAGAVAVAAGHGQRAGPRCPPARRSARRGWRGSTPVPVPPAAAMAFRRVPEAGADAEADDVHLHVAGAGGAAGDLAAHVGRVPGAAVGAGLAQGRWRRLDGSPSHDSWPSVSRMTLYWRQLARVSVQGVPRLPGRRRSGPTVLRGGGQPFAHRIQRAGQRRAQVGAQLGIGVHAAGERRRRPRSRSSSGTSRRSCCRPRPGTGPAPGRPCRRGTAQVRCPGRRSSEQDRGCSTASCSRAGQLVQV